MENLERLEHEFLDRVAACQSEQDIAELRALVLGKKSPLTSALRSLGDLDPTARRAAGQRVNEVKSRLDAALRDIHEKVLAVTRRRVQAASGYDVTLPGRRVVPGAPHPLREVEAAIIRAMTPLGFTVVEGPLVEHDWYNFEALNIPADHPARDMQDTFFLAPNVVLRTHTSNVQIRTMLKREPPVRVLAPGMVFRHDEVDATHSPVFHQVEGLWIDEHATLADLKGVLKHLVTQLFGQHAELRFRPSYFPFTEPSCEVDMSCFDCGSVGKPECRICKGTGWLEILGAGMVDPAVLQAVGYDPDRVQGFAFGMGIERIAQLLYGVDDMRLFYENDVRFLGGMACQRSARP